MFPVTQFCATLHAVVDMDKELRVWLESPSGERKAIEGSCFLGRAATCDVVIPDTKASRQHALVQGEKGSEFWLIDLGSANGTYVNGRRVGQPQRLFNADRITVAGITFIFHRPGTVSRPDSGTANPAKDATIPEVRTMTCWLLLADIEGSTQLIRKMAPDDVHRTTGLWLANCTKIIGDHQGTINKFLGDGFLAYWPEGPDIATRVTGALTALKQAQDKEDTRFRVVVHYGQVMAGGMASLGEESLSGNEVNLLFRAEKLAATLGRSRLLSRQANDKIQSLIPTVSEGGHMLAGFTGEFEFFSF